MLDRLAQQIANRNDSDSLITGHYWQVTNAMLMHKPQTVREGVIEIDGHDAACHDIRDRSCLWRLVGHDDSPDTVPFRQDPGYRSSFYNNKEADVLVGHNAEGCQHAIGRADCPQCPRL